MKAITLEKPGRFVLGQAPDPAAPGPGEAQVWVHRIGVCGTDYHAYRGQQAFLTYPRIVGHELGVEVVAVGENAGNVKPGDRCAVEPYIACGRCIACKQGKTNCCVDLKVLGVHCDGGMRERMNLPAKLLHPSSKLSFEQLALVEMLNIGCHAVDRGRPEPGENVLVVGAGPIGLSVVQFAALAGARVYVMDIEPRRLEFCRQHFDVAGVIDSRGDAIERLRGQFGGELPTAVFDATGNVHARNATFKLSAHGGRIVFVGIVTDDITFDDADFHRRELTVMASRNGLGALFTRIIGHMEAGRIDTQPWITHRADFDEMIPAFDHWLQPDAGVIKAIVSI
jgi:2-desacetyl-2-hydroxyethyl bacteriochlorophyllide A dehydrogenase